MVIANTLSIVSAKPNNSGIHRRPAGAAAHCVQPCIQNPRSSLGQRAIGNVHRQNIVGCNHTEMAAPDARIRGLCVNRAAIKNQFDWVPMDSPEGRATRGRRPAMSPHWLRVGATYRRFVRVPRREHHGIRRIPGVAFFTFFGETKKSDWPAAQSALVGTNHLREEQFWLVSTCGGLKPTLRLSTSSWFDRLTTNEYLRFARRTRWIPAAPRMTPWRVSERKIVVNDQRRMIRNFFQINLRLLRRGRNAGRGDLVVRRHPTLLA